MANPEHVEIGKQGVLAIRRWRDANPNEWLDLCEADLAAVKIEPTDILVLRKTKLGPANLQGANLREADLRGIDLEEATNLRNALLDKANLSAVKLIKAKLSKAHLVGANLVGADLSEADLDEADVSKADLSHAILGGTFLAKLLGAHRAYGIETVRSIPKSDSLVPTHDGRYFEYCVRPWPERWFDWERLRGVGRLPLFGVSYTVLLLIPIVFYVLALYNEKIDLVRAWALQAVTSPDHPLHQLAPHILDRLHPRPIPSLSFVLLTSTILLAIASTLYTFRCPSRIKEFSRDQWCDQLGHSLLHY
jgi:Pentapeptide repeats (8 copies)